MYMNLNKENSENIQNKVKKQQVHMQVLRHIRNIKKS